MMIFIIILAIGVFYFYNEQNKSANKRALEILDMKFIKGEISEEEYMNKKYLIERQ